MTPNNSLQRMPGERSGCRRGVLGPAPLSSVVRPENTRMKNTLLSLIVVLFLPACSTKTTPTSSAGTRQFTIKPADVASASVTAPAPTQQKAVVHVEFSKAQAEGFRKFTKEHLDQKVQILVGTKVVAEPVIRSEIPGGKIEL